MMKTKLRLQTTAARRGALLSLPLLAAAASPGYALDVYLKTGTTTFTPPGGAAITMWGYASCDSSFTTCDPVTVPGPAINVPATDTSLTIHLSNALSQPTSLVIDGLPMPTNSTGDLLAAVKYPSGDRFEGRVRSLTAEAASGATMDYHWSAVKPGSFLYRSGSHMQVQDQMGLYGAVSHNAVDPVAGPGPATPGQAYGAGSAFLKDVTLLYSEIDPVIHAAVAANKFGPYLSAGVDQCALPVSAPSTLPSGWVCSAVNYEPKYFLINGKTYDGSGNTEFATASIGQKTLLRLLNAGLQTHVPVLNGLDMTLVAEDGNQYPYAKTQYSAFLPAMKTIDAIIQPQANGRLSLIDHMLNLTNNGAAPGGMLAFLNVGAATNPTFASTGCLPGPNAATFNAAFNCQVTATDSTGGNAVSYSLVSGPAGLTMDSLGQVSWSAAIPAGSAQVVTVKAVDTANPVNASTASFTINVDGTAPSFDVSGCLSGPQVANLNSAFGCQVTGQPSVNTTTVVYSLISGPASLTMDANGLISWPLPTPAGSTNAVTVQIADADNTSNIATTSFNVNVQAAGPVAGVDPIMGTVFQGKPLNVAAPGVLDNDTSNVPAPNDGLTARLVSTTPNGTLLLNANGGFSYTPNAGFSGDDSFSYQAVDSTGTASTAVTATITVTPNTAPVAGNDGVYTVTAGRNFILPANGVLGNDSDVDNPAQGQVLTLSKMTNPLKGTVALNANGGLTYTPAFNQSGADSFTYKLNDGIANSNIATVSFDIVNTAPVAVDDSVAVSRNRSLSIAVLANDTDAEGNINTTSVTRVTQAAHGTAVISTTGNITYTPARGYVGVDSFTYRVADKVGALSNIATVNLCVGVACPVADAFTAPGVGAFDVAAPGVLVNDAPLAGVNTATLVAGSLSRVGSTLGTTTLRCSAPNAGSSSTATKICPNGAFTLNAPAPGTYVFQYRMTTAGITSSPVSVTVTVP